MTPPLPDQSLPPALQALRERLSGGIAADLQAAHPAPYHPDVVWGRLDGPLRALWALDGATAAHDRTLARVEAAIEGFRRHLASGQDTAAGADDPLSDLASDLGESERAEWRIRELVYAPHALLERSMALDPDQHDPRAHWARACLVAEAVWRRVSTAGEHEAETRRLRPLAARTRFLLLSEPHRHRGDRAGLWAPTAYERSSPATHGAVGWAFGKGTPRLLLERARAARRDWLAYLDTYQSHPVLAQLPPHQMETELRQVASARGYRTGPLTLSPRPLDQPDPPAGTDLAAAREVAERHLLPRFRAVAVALLFGAAPPVLAGPAEPAWRRLVRRCWAVRRHAVSVAVLGCLAATLFLALWRGDFPAATTAAVATYLSVGAGTVCFGAPWAAQWLLRLPAAASVGLLPLLAFPDWWQRARLDWPPPPAQWVPVAVLVGAALGYLVVEARNHGVSGPAACLRALGVGCAGAAHALLVSLVGLVAVAPAFAERTAGPGIAALWSGGAGDPVAVLLSATGWCLAVGVFSQILWEDRPITAPLAHLRWREEG